MESKTEQLKPQNNALEEKLVERRKWLQSLKFFDAHCQLYPNMNSDVPHLTDKPETLLAEMDRCGVEKAMVFHGNAEAAGAACTNDEISQGIKPYSHRLVGIWSILPQQCNEIPPADKLFERMAQEGIGALTLFPVAHKWQPNRLTIGKVMDAAAERKVPVYISTKYFDGAWKGVYDFMKEFPRNTVILANVRLWGADRNIRPLLENYPNFHVELGEYWVPEGVYDLAKLYGAHRLLYGSDQPAFAHGSTMLYIINSKLPYEDITKIASGNMNRLINLQ